MLNSLSKAGLLCLLLLSVGGCESGKAQSDKNSLVDQNRSGKPIPVACKRLSPPADIWKLEKMLTEKGDINDQMDTEEKEKVIRAYIAKKNSQYQICLKSGGNK